MSVSSCCLVSNQMRVKGCSLEKEKAEKMHERDGENTENQELFKINDAFRLKVYPSRVRQLFDPSPKN